MIEFQSVEFHYPGHGPVFEAFDWQIGEGEAWAVLGPSGCGKSTLLYLMAGLRFPLRGRVLVAGEALTKPRPRTGLILQDYGLLPWATVFENANLGLRLRRFYGPDGRHAPRRSMIEDIEAQALLAGWTVWGWPRWQPNTPARSPAASASALPSPAPWPPTPTCC